MKGDHSDVCMVGGGFVVRRLGTADVAGLRALRADADVRRWSNPEQLTCEQACSEIEAAEVAWREGSSFLFAIADSDNILGAIRFTRYEPSRASLGYDLIAEARGRGIATSAVRLVAKWAFDEFPQLVRLELWTALGNGPSERVAERAGFTREGVLRSRLPFQNELRDVTVFSLLRSDRS